MRDRSHAWNERDQSSMVDSGMAKHLDPKRLMCGCMCGGELVAAESRKNTHTHTNDDRIIIEGIKTYYPTLPTTEDILERAAKCYRNVLEERSFMSFPEPNYKICGF